MDFNHIKSQLELAKKTVAEMNEQNRIFGNIMSDVLKGAPAEAKKEIHAVQVMSKRAIALAKQGKLEESQQLIKDFQNGRQNT